MPKDWDTEGIFYNKNYFAAHHITIPSSLTWNPVSGGSFLRLARQATTDANGVNALSPKLGPATIATYGVSVVNQPDIGLVNLGLKDHVAPPASEYGSNGAAPTNQDVTSACCRSRPARTAGGASPTA